MLSCFAAFADEAAQRAPATKLITVFGERVTPANAWREYPRPQLVRSAWTCLNGEWDYAVTAVTNTPCRPWDPDGKRGEIRAQGKILVPFGIEAKLSGVGRMMEPDELLWYTRKITCEPRRGSRILLHFDGVDFRAMVFIGHREVTEVPHFGAQEPFTLDITDYVQPGENELTVCVWDPTDQHLQSRGKQTKWPQGCTYTRYSGIWQSVWMENVPESYVAAYKVVPDIDSGTVTFTFETKGPDPAEDVEVEVLENGKVIAKGEADGTRPLTVKMPRNFKLWSPETPNLYTFRAKYEHDAFTGYFAMRKFSKGKDKDGYLRFFLNNRPYFPIGTLDQGWWPDGLLTPPSDEAMKFDIETLKACGFNMMRKHIKIEPRQFYFLCDKIGILLFQDATSPACNSQDKLRALQRYGLFRREWKEEIDHLFNVPSIVMWMPYNEASGQQDMAYSEDVLRWTRRYDPTRLVGGPSGWNDYWGGDMFDTSRGRGQQEVRDPWETECGDPPCDTVDGHYYPGPGQCVKHRNRISILGEFGGLGLKVPDHIWREKGIWGYAGTGEVVSRESNQRHYLKLMDGLKPLIRDGLAATVYTQTTDIELEINGLITYDRKVLKYDADALKEAAKKCNPVILEPIMDVEVTVPTEYLGSVMGDITKRRGHINEQEERGNAIVIRAFIPLSEMFGYATDLRSFTQGRGNYMMQMDHYAEVPSSIAETIAKKNAR